MEGRPKLVERYVRTSSIKGNVPHGRKTDLDMRICLGYVRRSKYSTHPSSKETAHEDTNDSSVPLLRISRSECSGTRFKHGRSRWLWHGRERHNCATEGAQSV